MSYQTYKTLSNLRDSIQAATVDIVGINSFYMIDESEVNKLHNINYPTCILEIPNSSVSNLNKAWEDYDLSFLILKKKLKTYTDSEYIDLYDDCVSLFGSLLENILTQRLGDYVADRESIEIERIHKFGNDVATGVKVNITISMPSILIKDEIQESPALSGQIYSYYTSVSDGLKFRYSGLYGFRKTSHSFVWNTIQGDDVPLLRSGINPTPNLNISDSSFKARVEYQVEAHTPQEPLPSSSIRTMARSGVTAASNNEFSIFFNVHLPDSANTFPFSTLFSLRDPNDISKYISVSLGTFQSGENRLYIRYGNVLESISNFAPVGSETELLMFGIYNNPDSDLTNYYIDDGVNVSTGVFTSHAWSVSEGLISNWDLYIGAYYNLYTQEFSSQFVGLIDDIVFYDRGLTSAEISTLKGQL